MAMARVVASHYGFMIEQFDSAWNVFEFDPRLHASSALKDSTTREPREYAKRTAERAVAAELSYGTHATTRPSSLHAAPTPPRTEASPTDQRQQAPMTPANTDPPIAP